MKIAAVQMVSTPDWPSNRDAAARLVAQAAAAGAKLVALPEYFCLMGQRDSDKLALAEPTRRRAHPGLSGRHRRASTAVAGGRHAAGAQRGTPGKVLNRCCVFAPDGSRPRTTTSCTSLPTTTAASATTKAAPCRPAQAPVAVQAGPLRVGLSICYDLRFPELYRALMQPPCDVLCVPAAFTYTTGQAHWELLLRARAVENQCYVLAAAQGGTHPNGRRTWGHSMVVGPWGEVLAVCEAEGEGLAVAEVDPAHLAQVRQQLPALAHRRL
jgi:predicted amidohydrolase